MKFSDPPTEVDLTCKKCGKTTRGLSYWGSIPVYCGDCQKADEAERVAQERRERLATRFGASGIPARPLTFTPDRMDVVASILEGDRGLYVWGPTGRGKTVLISRIAKDFLEADKGSVKFITANRLVYEAQQTYSMGSSMAPLEYIDKMGRVALLAIDDLGRNKVSEDAKRILFEIMDERAKANRRTLITSEKSLEEMRNLLDEAFVGRIIETCEVLHVTGRDWRLPLFEEQ